MTAQRFTERLYADIYTFMWSFANPNKFMRVSGYILPVAASIAILLFAYGIYQGLYVVPPERVQGDSARIIFVHVPAAAMSIMVYMMMCTCSLFALIWRHPVADLSAKAAAPIGAAFTLLALVTGALWGYPTWGTWWVWDARLTSELILFFFYIGYIALWDAFDDESKAAPAAAIFCLVGSIFAVLAKYSVELWETLHQPPSLSITGERNVDDVFRTPLLAMMAAFGLYFLSVWLVRVRTEIRARRVKAIRLAAARE